MVNTDDFIKRLEIILDYYGLNASSFADKIGVQRSSLSHLLSGRNKPSLDFILKILDVFPDVDLYWILNGKGTFPKNIEHIDKKETVFEEVVKQNIPTPLNNESIPENLFSEIKNTNPITVLETKNTETQNTAKESNSSEIDKIVIFYKNGTFKSYVPD
ncbi:helix-turn-helix domain-containing protein [Flavobacterium sp. LB1P62]|uniref:helix-turn-helix domain-containing protein n=1 Tax=unclassified Flavobacterium TaxID=196869 RepID=UPI003AB08BF6